MKTTAKDEIREILKGIDGLYGCWIESSRKVRNQDKYDLVVRMDSDGVPLGVLDEVSRVLNAESVTIESGYEITGCCELCSGPETYLEIDIGGATLPVS